MKRLLLVLFLCLLAVPSVGVRAAIVDSESTAATNANPNPTKAARMEERTEQIDAMKAQKASQIEAMKAEKAAMRAQYETERMEKLEALKAKKEEMRETMAAKKTEMQVQLKERLQVIRDNVKLKTAERIQERLTMINENRTEHFRKILERLTMIIDKIQTRTDKAKSEGKSTADIESAIAAAKSAIDSAIAAVEAQSGNTYEISVTDESTAREEIKATSDDLHEDLKQTRETVKSAADAVQQTFRTVKTVVGESSGSALNAL